MLSKIYTPKQIEILKACRNSDWFMLINHGAKRSGKTQLDNDLFLAELRKVRQMADQLGIDTPQYILAGYSLGNIQDNILTSMKSRQDAAVRVQGSSQIPTRIIRSTGY